MTQRTKTPFRHHCHFCQELPAMQTEDFRPFCQLCQPVNGTAHHFAASILDALTVGLTAEQIKAAIRSAGEATR